jgi:hypothetical protein
VPSADSPGIATLGTLDDIPIVMDVIFPSSTPAYITTQIDNNVVPYYAGNSVGDERLAIDVSFTDSPSSITTADPVDSGDLHIDVGALPSGGSLDLSVWFIHPDGTRDPLPHFTNLTISPIANDVGSVSIEYPVYGLNFDLLQDIQRNDRDYEIAIWLFGRDTNSMRVLLTDASGDEVKEDAVWTFTGTFLEGRMKEVITFPNAADPSGKFQTLFSAATPGTIMRTLMAQAQGRGAVSDITYTSFSDERDSKGALWNLQTTLAFSPGTTYISILQALVGYGMCEWEINSNHELRIYNAGTKGADLTLLSPPVVLYKGRNITDGPRKYSNRDAATTLLASGKDATYYDQTDATALARRGRRIEKLAAAGNNLADLAALTSYVQAELPAVVAGTMELSHGLVFGAGYPLPAFGFNVGDWVWSDSTGVKERLRILQWTLTNNTQGTTGTITLNDFLRDYLSKLALKLSAIEDGVVVAGTSTQDPAEDKLAPATPTGLIASSQAYYDAGHNGYSEVQATWDAVLLNTDGTACGDLAGYRLRWRALHLLASGISGWSVLPINKETTVTWGTVPQGLDIEMQVLAEDNNGNQSPWSLSYFHTTSADALPPPKPSTPICTNFLGVVTIKWDGLGFYGEAMPFDFDHVDVYISTSAGFAPDPSLLFGHLNANGGLVYTTTNYAVEVFACFVAVDQNGNASSPSDVSGATPNQVLNQDLFAGCVGTAQLQELVVKNANIDLLAVNDAQIGDLSVGKLTAGIMTATVLLAGVIRTDWTGARTEIDNAGLRLFNTAGDQTINLNGTSNLITGTIKTALTGKRWELQPDTTMRYYHASGDYSQFTSYDSWDGSAVMWRAPLNGSGFSGRISVTTIGVNLSFSEEADLTNLHSEILLREGDVMITSPLIQFKANNEYPVTSGFGGTPRIVFMFKNVSGVDVPNTTMFYQFAPSDQPWFAAPFTNSGLVFDAHQLVCQDGGRNPIAILASAFTVISSREAKYDIQDMPFSALDVIRGAKSQAWRYKQNPRAEYPVEPDEGEEPIPWAYPEEESPLHFGPIAEDLQVVSSDLTPLINGVLGSDTRDLVGVLWAGEAELLDRVEILEQEIRRLNRITAIEEDRDD